MDASFFSGVFGLAVLAFLVIIGVLWFCLPFAVFGLKGRIDGVAQQIEGLGTLLQAIHKSSEDARVDERANTAAIVAAINAQTAALSRGAARDEGIGQPPT